jgi:hypothetical protein
MKFVVAGNVREYNQHIHKMGYNKNEYVFVSDVIQLRGLETIEGFYLGTYKDRPDLNQINSLIQIIKHRNKGLGVQPTSIMLKNAGAWQIYDINNGEVK